MGELFLKHQGEEDIPYVIPQSSTQYKV